MEAVPAKSASLAVALEGEVNLQAGQPREARRMFSRALELDPANHRALAGLSARQTR